MRALRQRRLWLLTAALLAGCQTPAPVPAPTPTVESASSARQWPLPEPPRAVTEVAAGRAVTGTVSLGGFTNPAFAKNAAYRVAAIATGQALVTATTLEESLLSINGQVITATTDASGRFKLAEAPQDFPFVATATLGRNHRLSAIVLAAQTDVKLDEVTTAVAETARWQARTAPLAGQTDAVPTLRGLTAEALALLTTMSAPFVTPATLGTDAGAAQIPALRSGAGTVLRNAYVGAFGAQVTASGSSGADKLSDAWKAFLGVRPLAMTRVAGGGAEQEDGEDARGSMLLSPIDAQGMANGDLILTEADSHTIRVVPKSNRTGWGAHPDAMKAGKLYTVAGLVNGPRSFEAFDPIYRPFEAASATDPDAAPKVYDATLGPFPLLTPFRLVQEDAGANQPPHLFFTSPAANRVFFLPGADLTRYGRSFKAGRVYTVAGTGAVATDASQLGDGGAATLSRLLAPSGLTKDSRNNLWVLDAGTAANAVHGRLRLVRAGDGTIRTLELKRNGAAYPIVGAADVRVVEASGGNFVYIADTRRHCVVRAPLPADLATLDTAPPASLAVEVVLGTPEKAGVFTGGLPDLLQANAGVNKATVLLDSPSSVAFDGAGNMLVADAGNGRVRLVEKGAIAGEGKVYTLSGGFKTSYLEGDARLANLPSTTYLNAEAGGNVLFADRLANVVRRLWTARGSI